MSDSDEMQVISDIEIKQIREALGRYNYTGADAQAVRDHYSPRKMNGDTCVGFQHENPAVLALELMAVLAAREIAQEDPDRNPAEHESTFLDHLDYLREAAAKLGPLGVDRLLDDQVWFWPQMVAESTPSREQLVQDVRAQVEAEVSRRMEAVLQQGVEMGIQMARGAADPGLAGRPGVHPAPSRPKAADVLGVRKDFE